MSSYVNNFKTSLRANYGSQRFDLDIIFEASATPKHLRLECDLPLDEYKTRLPFAYQLADVMKDSQFDVQYPGSRRTIQIPVFSQLLVVAGPGVKINSKGFDPSKKPSFFQPSLEVVRVQDPDLVPRQTSGINPAHYAGAGFLPEEYWEVFTAADRVAIAGGSEEDIDLQSNPTHVTPKVVHIGEALKSVFLNNQTFFYLDVPIQPPIVEVKPDGLVYRDVTTDSEVTVTIPAIGQDSDEAWFSYWIEYDGRAPTILHIHKTAPVNVEFSSLYRKEIADGDPFPIDHFPFGPMRNPDEIADAMVDKFEVRVRETAMTPDFPVNGLDVPVDTSHSIVPLVPATEEEEQAMLARSIQYGKDGIDIGVSMLPVVGDVVDLAEALAGYDKWGKKLSTFDRILTGACVVVPFVGGAGIRAVRERLTRSASGAL